MTTTTTGRRAAKRTATRTRLLEAARELIGEGGFDAVTVAGLTERADVGFGTFYGYFDTKEAVVHAVILDAVAELAEANDALTAQLSDPAEVIATAIQHTLGTVDRDPVLAGFILRVGLSADEELWTALRTRMERDISAGVATGRFTSDRPAIAGHMIGGSVLGVLRAKLHGDLEAAADATVAACALVLLGITEGEATDIAARTRP